MEQTITYIDDNEANLLLIKKALSKEFQVITLDSPEQALENLNEQKPDLVLLDVNMPKIDGYELCRQLREVDELKQLPVVFLTARTSLEDRLTGFEAGGDAYVTKPYDLEELKYIVKSQLARYRLLMEAEGRVEAANSMAWTMMQNNSEIGQVLQYARSLSHTRDEQALVDNTFEAFAALGLTTTLSLRTEAGEMVARSDKKPFSEIEHQLLQMAKHGERIIHIKNKYLFCASRCTFLIKNMPIEDEALTGRLRDHLAIMLESCDACIELICLRQREKQAQVNAASRTQTDVLSEFQRIIHLFDRLNENAEQAFNRLSMNIENSFMFLGLTEEQEGTLARYIEEAKEDIDKVLEGGHILKDAMSRVADSIDKLVEN